VTYRLDAVVVESDEVRVEVPTGMAFQSRRDKDDVEVAVGEELGKLVVDPANEAALTHGDGTVAASRLGVLQEQAAVVHAPVAGIAKLDDAGARVRRPGLDVTADLSPLQTLRYEGMAFAGSAEVETVVGQRRVACDAVWLSAADDTEGAGSRVHCRLPDNVETVPGVPAVMVLSSPTLDDVVAVPYLYVGLDDVGENYVVSVLEGGEAVERPVVVGTTDGVRRVIRSGVEHGDELVEVPQ
jgi:hypothetical protein